MPEETLTLPEIKLPAAADPSFSAPVEPLPPRPYLPLHLPDGRALHLSAGIMVDLASMFQVEEDAVFTGYLPRRMDEAAFLLWMASRDPQQRGAEWRRGDPALLSDFATFREVVMRWIDVTFRPSEFSRILVTALELWQHHTSPVAVPKKEEAPAPAPEAPAPVPETR